MKDDIALPAKDASGNAPPAGNPVGTLSRSPLATKKMADHPHLWTLLLSLIAIGVSAFSLYQSVLSRQLNEAVNRPLVRVTAIRAGNPFLGSTKINGTRMPKYYSIELTNSGRSFANNVSVTYKAQLEDTRCCKDFLKFSDTEHATTSADSVGDIAPDDKFELGFLGQVLKDNPTIPIGDHTTNMVSLYVDGDVQYTSPLNNQTYHEHFCFVDFGTYGAFQRCLKQQPKYK
jgi:hypothetical protein